MVWAWVLVQALYQNGACTVLCSLTVHTLCYAVFLQTREKKPLRAAEMPMGRRQMEEVDKICVQQGYIRASHWRALLLNKGSTPSISFFLSFFFFFFSQSWFWTARNKSQTKRVLNLFSTECSDTDFSKRGVKAFNLEFPAVDKTSLWVAISNPYVTPHLLPCAEHYSSWTEQYPLTGSAAPREQKKEKFASPFKKSHFVQPDVLQNGTAALLEGGRASHPGGARRGGGGPRPAPGGAEANGRWGGGGRLLPPCPPYIAPGSGAVPSVGLSVPSRAEPSRARMPGRTVWRLALLALCLGAAAAGGHRRGAGGKSRRQAQTQTTSLPQGTAAAQGKREYRPRAGQGQGTGWPWGAFSVPRARPSARRTRTRVRPAPLPSRLLPSVTPNFAFSTPCASPFLLLSPQRPAMTMDGTIR